MRWNTERDSPVLLSRKGGKTWLRKSKNEWGTKKKENSKAKKERGEWVKLRDWGERGKVRLAYCLTDLKLSPWSCRGREKRWPITRTSCGESGGGSKKGYGGEINRAPVKDERRGRNN